VGDITDFEVGGVKPFHILTVGLAGVIADWLADDLIGENQYTIPIANLMDFKPDNYQASMWPSGTDGLPFDVQVNWPPKPEQVKVFTGDKGGFYKGLFQYCSD
jgi:hypothetical protein